MGPGGDAQVHLGPFFPVLAGGHGLDVDADARRRGILLEHLGVADDVRPLGSHRQVDIDAVGIAGFLQELLCFGQVVRWHRFFTILRVPGIDVEILPLHALPLVGQGQDLLPVLAEFQR